MLNFELWEEGNHDLKSHCFDCLLMTNDGGERYNRRYKSRDPSYTSKLLNACCCIKVVPDIQEMDSKDCRNILE